MLAAAVRLSFLFSSLVIKRKKRASLAGFSGGFLFRLACGGCSVGGRGAGGAAAAFYSGWLVGVVPAGRGGRQN
jgi:hypothetical protein